MSVDWLAYNICCDRSTESIGIGRGIIGWKQLTDLTWFGYVLDLYGYHIWYGEDWSERQTSCPYIFPRLQCHINHLKFAFA